MPPTWSLPIGEQLRMIRFYEETATIVMSDDTVCELSFQPDPEDRRVTIDNGDVVIFTRVNQGYKEFELDGEKHELKIGPPTRELWIDGKWYECCFNNCVRVKLGNSLHEVFLEGNPPIVKIGEKRPDLCLGQIYAVVDFDLNRMIPVYLDGKPQLIDIAGKPHIIQFDEGYKTLTINGHPFRSDFGGFPMVILVHGKKHYLRLTTLPPGINLDKEDSETGETRQLAVSTLAKVSTRSTFHFSQSIIFNSFQKAQALDDITSSLSGLINSLDTTIMFTTAGTLELGDAEAGANTCGELREDILRLAQVLVQDVQALLVASTGTTSELTSTASVAHENIGQLVETIRAGAASLGSNNKETQVMLLNTAKDVTISLHGLISQAKSANGHNVDHPAYNQVSDYSKGVIMNITNFLKSVKMFKDESSRGTRAVESSIEAIAQEIHEFSTGISGAASGAAEASPEDVITHATQAIQRSLVSPDSANETTSMSISTELDKSKGLVNSTSSSTDNPNQDCDNTQDMFDCTFDMSSVLGDGVLCMEKEITPQSSQLTPVKPSNVTLQTETPKFMAEILVNVTPGNPKNDAVILSSAPVAPSPNKKSVEGRGNLTGVKKKKRKSKKVEREEKKANKEFKIRQYNLAIEAFKDNKFNTYYSCAKKHGVSSSTLKRLIVTGKNYVGQGKINKVLKESEQQLLCDHLKEASRIGFGYTYYDLRLIIQELLQGLVTSNPARAETIPWENLWPPQQFAFDFCKKYQLKLRKTMHLSEARAEITPEDLATWAKKIETILVREEYAEILKDPRRVFNNVRFHMLYFFLFNVNRVG